MRAGRLDLGIALGPLQEAGLVFEAMLHEELVLATPTGHPLTRTKAALDLAAFSKESFIVPPRDVAPGLYDLIISRCYSSGFAPRITQHARQMQTVISLVAAGMGVALVPSSVQNLKRAGVRYRRIRGAGAGVEIGILRPLSIDGPLQNNFTAALKHVVQRYTQAGR
jgi:DNA-binding transcriptional LysR family regulator